MTDHAQGQELTPDDRVTLSQRWLDEHPDAPLCDRAAHATVVACGGEVGNQRVTFGDVARILDEPASDVLQGLLAVREQAEARRSA